MAGVHVGEAEPELAVPLDIELADTEEAEAEIAVGEARVRAVRVAPAMREDPRVMLMKPYSTSLWRLPSRGSSRSISLSAKIR